MQFKILSILLTTAHSHLYIPCGVIRSTVPAVLRFQRTLDLNTNVECQRNSKYGVWIKKVFDDSKIVELCSLKGSVEEELKACPPEVYFGYLNILLIA